MNTLAHRNTSTYTILNHPHPLSPILSHSALSHPTPTLSYPILSYLIPPYPIPSYLIPPYSILLYSTLSCPSPLHPPRTGISAEPCQQGLCCPIQELLETFHP